MEINESPIYVLINPAINHAGKELPVTIYESGRSSSRTLLLFIINGKHVEESEWNKSEKVS